MRDVAIQESPADELSTAATQALEQWTFEPATKDGEPVAVSYIVTLNSVGVADHWQRRGKGARHPSYVFRPSEIVASTVSPTAITSSSSGRYPVS